jgi:ATP-binding cassette subfamily C protein LapB
MTANMQQQADLHGVLVEAVDGIEDLKAAGAQGRFVRQYEQSTAAAATTQLRSRSVTSWTINFSSVAQQLVTLVFLVWGVHLIGAKELTTGALVAGMMFAGRAIAPLQSVVMLAMRYQGARAAMRALNQIMGQPVEREAGRSYVSQAGLQRPHRAARGGLCLPGGAGRQRAAGAAAGDAAHRRR